MTKTTKRTLILTLALLLMLSLAALFMGFLKASAAPTTDTGEWDGGGIERGSTLPSDARLITPGEDLSGRTLFFDGVSFHAEPYYYYNRESISIQDGTGVLTIQFMYVTNTLHLTITKGDTEVYKETDDGVSIVKITLPEKAIVSAVDVYFYDQSPQHVYDTTAFIYVSDSYDGIEAEPEDPADTNEDPAADEGTIFDKASEWLQTNTGIAVSSGGIVVIGVIILLLIFTKRK